MSPATAKRFWKTTSVGEDERGYTILLDDREVKTPQGLAFFLQSEGLAHKIRDEWDAQLEGINPETMPMFRFAVTALDRIAPQRRDVVDEIASYGGSDLLCYREERDQRLAAHQHEIWQPYVDWAEGYFKIKISVFSGLMPGHQSAATKSKLRGVVERYDDAHLSGLHSLVTTSGSLILGLAVVLGEWSLDDIMRAAFLDDLWQEDKWGYDEEAAVRLERHRQQIADADCYLRLLV